MEPGGTQEGEKPCVIARLEQFAEKAIHDLREPLSVVMLALELLGTNSSETLNAETGKFLGYAIKGAQQLQAVMSDLQLAFRTSGRGRRHC
jgi:signal transduction histidine kinase